MDLEKGEVWLNIKETSVILYNEGDADPLLVEELWPQVETFVNSQFEKKVSRPGFNGLNPYVFGNRFAEQALIPQEMTTAESSKQSLETPKTGLSHDAIKLILDFPQIVTVEDQRFRVSPDNVPRLAGFFIVQALKTYELAKKIDDEHEDTIERMREMARENLLTAKTLVDQMSAGLRAQYRLRDN